MTTATNSTNAPTATETNAEENTDAPDASARRAGETDTNEISIVVTEGDQSTLSRLAEQINDATRAAEASIGSAVIHALTAGRLLIEVKTQVEHGSWETWVTTNCSVAPRTARAYMRLAAKYPELPDEKRQRVADLPVRQAIRAIATTPQSPPRQQRSIVVEGHDALRERNDAIRAAATFRKGATALRRAAERLGAICEMDDKQLQYLRRKLMAVIEVLDQLGEKSE